MRREGGLGIMKYAPSYSDAKSNANAGCAQIGDHLTLCSDVAIPIQYVIRRTRSDDH